MEVSDVGLRPGEALFRALARAEDSVSRLEERAAACPFVEGWRRRADVRAVLAQAWVRGDLVHPEDLLLNVLASDTSTPELAVVRANANLRARDKAWRAGPELLSWAGVAWLLAERREPPPPGPRPTLRLSGQPPPLGSLQKMDAFFHKLQRGTDDSPRVAVEQCLEVLDAAAGAPALLVAAALLEAWRIVEPLQGRAAIGGILSAVHLKVAGRFTSALFPVEVSLRRRRMPARLAWAPFVDRLTFHVETLEHSARLELEEINRLKLQKAVLDRRVGSARRGGKAAAFAALALDYPVLTTDLIAQQLGITTQGAGQLLQRMQGVVHEITGRTRYRVWRL